jgi:hypothetical protein
LYLKRAPKILLKSKRNRSQNNLPENNVEQVPAKSSTLFSGGLFWRQLRFGENSFHIIFWRIVLKAAKIWRELVPHYFPVDYFGGSSDLAGTTTKKTNNHQDEPCHLTHNFHFLFLVKCK